jgi:putative tricarboxylic transport membrane protein
MMIEGERIACILMSTTRPKLETGGTTMTTRRQILKASLAGSALLAAGLKMPAFSAAPTSLQIFIPAAPGGGWDQTGRAMEQAMRAEGIANEFQFEHVGGAGGTVGLPQFLSNKAGQGDAILVGGMVMVGAIIANKSQVKLTDTTPLARLTGESEVVVVPGESALKSMADLVAALKADPAQVSWGGGSAGGTDHILAGMIAKASGVDPKAVAYVAYAGGGEATAAILGAQVTCGVSGYGEFEEHIKAGTMRALAISADQRQAGIDVPTLKEQGIDVELFNWRGVFGAPGITPEQKADLVGMLDKMANSAAWKKILEEKKWTGIYLAGDEFTKYLDNEITRITGILTDLGLAS